MALPVDLEPNYLSNLPRETLLHILPSLSQRALMNLAATSKEMYTLILKNSERISAMKWKREYSEVNNRTKCALFDFIKEQYPFIIDLFILNERVANILNDIVEKKPIYETTSVNLGDFNKLLQEYRSIPTAKLYINFYKFRYLNIAVSSPPFEKDFDNVFESGDTDLMVRKGNAITLLIDTANAANNSINAADVRDFPTNRREEWNLVYTQLLEKLLNYRARAEQYYRERREAAAQRKAAELRIKKAAADAVALQARQAREAAAAARSLASSQTAATAATLEGRVTRSRTRAPH